MKKQVSTIRLSGRVKTRVGLSLLLVWLLLFHETLKRLYDLALSDVGHSHILAVPFLAAYFLFSDRNDIFQKEVRTPRKQSLVSTGFLVSGGLLLVNTIAEKAPPTIDNLSLSMTAAVFLLFGLALAFIPGIDLRRAYFHGFLLFLMVPIPSVLREGLVTFLVNGSATFTEGLFRLTGTTYFRQGTTFSFPGLVIEIAKECSGIRSSIGLFLTLLIASHLFLRQWLSKWVLIAMVIPMVLVKNAVRITTLTLLALHIDKMFLLNSPLHRGGGVVFFAISLIPILLVLVVLRKMEKKKDGTSPQKGSVAE